MSFRGWPFRLRASFDAGGGRHSVYTFQNIESAVERLSAGTVRVSNVCRDVVLRESRRIGIS